MAPKLQAGDFKNRARFEARAVGDDGYGNPVSGDWEEKFKVWVALRPGGLSEAVVAARLEGTQVLNVYVRASTQTRQITSEWRMIVADHGVDREYAINAQPDGLTMPGFIYFQAKSGVAA
ncbi:SPP1 family predicted phage head-tail adaptor [Neorhizobium huautlense]|uniref:SPP1 family predicted phage head-tail adaptor n=1 Tax=Neorhizobium huautlense TaxID=67774 RepID=A0ABT9PT03_9HYPH|nr:head-tail adaptor protein [Neorhizobium huautlense]MDP9837597.1 SPP1 family predicted phage head-tail adaptor [Neorhizobium huautlense]